MSKTYNVLDGNKFYEINRENECLIFQIACSRKILAKMHIKHSFVKIQNVFE